jgi:hypothetical protein
MACPRGHRQRQHPSAAARFVTTITRSFSGPRTQNDRTRASPLRRWHQRAIVRLVAEQMQMVWHIEMDGRAKKSNEAFAKNGPIREGE